MHMCLYNERYTSNKTIYVSFICTCVCTMKDIHQIKLFMYVSYAHVFVQWKIYIKYNYLCTFHMHMCLYNERYTSNKTIYVRFICTCVCTMKDIHQIKLFM